MEIDVTIKQVVIYWTDVKSVDVIPVCLLSPGDHVHQVVDDDGKSAPASYHCTQKPGAVILNYGGKHRQVNVQNGMDIGETRISAEGEVSWRGKKAKTFKNGLAIVQLIGVGGERN